MVLDVNNVEEKVVDKNKGKTSPRSDTPTNLNKDNKNQEDNVAEQTNHVMKGMKEQPVQRYKSRDETIQNMTSRKNTPCYFFLKGICDLSHQL